MPLLSDAPNRGNLAAIKLFSATEHLPQFAQTRLEAKVASVWAANQIELLVATAVALAFSASLIIEPGKHQTVGHVTNAQYMAVL